MGETSATKLFDMYDGYAPIQNLLGIGDPDVHKIGDRWWMFFGGFQTTFKNNLFSASLPPGAPLSSNAWSITTIDSDPHTAISLVAQPDDSAWDAYGLHTPSYVQGIDHHAEGGAAERERVYYTGRSSEDSSGEDSLYSIGVLEKTDEGWVRRPSPILTGTAERPSVLEPKARYFEGKWRIWYVSAPNEVGPGELPQYRIEYVESENGVTNWSTPKVLFSTAEGYSDSVVIPVEHGYEMVVSGGRNLHATPGFPPRGLWWLRSKTPSGDRNDWTTNPIRILNGDNGEPWHADGAHGPSIRYGDTEEDHETLYVFFTGIRHPTDPPFPAPYFFAIGRMEASTSGLQ